MSAMTRVGARFWVEAGSAAVGAALMLLTMLSREWIEWLTGTDPDAGSGALAWAIVADCLGVSVVAGSLSRHEWRRASTPA
jgi:hypothetical protein